MGIVPPHCLCIYHSPVSQAFSLHPLQLTSFLTPPQTGTSLTCQLSWPKHVCLPIENAHHHPHPHLSAA